MLDFFRIKAHTTKSGTIEVSPSFTVGRSEDLMVRGGDFYAIWNEETKLWSTDEYDVQKIVDAELYKWLDENRDSSKTYSLKTLQDFDSNQWAQFQRFVNNLSDNARSLDDRVIFEDQATSKTDYATRKLKYSLSDNAPHAWNEIVDVLYSKPEREKFEWAIGAALCGEASLIQKFIVFYGPPGTGKSTIIDVIQGLFDGYTTIFDAKSLGSSNSQFSTSVFKNNPVVAIQHDGDLSKLSDNTKLNTIVSHEDIIINEKNKPTYTTRVNAILFMGTNGLVKISDAQSGLIRRLIDVKPTGEKLPYKDYIRLTNQVKFEYGAIANKCMKFYRETGPGYFNHYRPTEMMYKTDPFLSFISDNYDFFTTQEYVVISKAYDLYKSHASEYGGKVIFNRQDFQNELSNYFKEYHKSYRTTNGERVRNVYTEFDYDKIDADNFDVSKDIPPIDMSERPSIFDKEALTYPAQYANDDGIPSYRWDNVRTKLKDLDTRRLHYVKVPENHIVIDFDLKVDGEKSLEANIKAASEFPETYGEVSKSGKGVHLHYIYDGDVSKLQNIYSDGIEIKVFSGGSSLRRMLTRCSPHKIATISSGLPLKEEVSNVLSDKQLKSEKSLRELLTRNLRKEIHPGTKPSVEFIKKILDGAYDSDLSYDVTDMRSVITTFASLSTNHALTCIKMVKDMKFASEDRIEDKTEDASLLFFDVEVYPNYFLIVYKNINDDACVVMENPTPEEVGALFDFRLVGFNNRRYDNHILYARYLGYTNEMLYDLSQRIISNDRNALFASAYNLSYTDIYDFASKKQSLKKWEFELGIKHMEMDIPWDQPVPEEKKQLIIEYCKNDVLATEAVFDHLRGDFMARQILADLSGLSVNRSTQSHTAKIIFGDNKEPQDSFIYTNLATGARSDGTFDTVAFKGYTFDRGKSSYKGEDVGEGGYVYAEPGIYENVALIDVASMHPNSIRNLEMFGKYTKKFTDLVDARVAIKHQDYDTASEMLDGVLKPYLNDRDKAADLAYALKIVINIVYGLTAAKFKNSFKDDRNIDNIVAKRGALFMVDLKEAVQKEGYTVVHIKTDSIKIANADEYIVDFVTKFGKEYGYDFEHEATYDKLCLVNDAVYVARDSDKWYAVGAQFKHPYVYKTLFSGEPITRRDITEDRSVAKGDIWIDYGEGKARTFIGRAAQLIPVKVTHPFAGTALRVHEEKDYALTGTKGYLWTPAERFTEDDEYDESYFEELVHEAKETIEKYGSYKELIS